MLAAMLEETGRVAIRDVAEPQPDEDEVLIDVAYAGVCGSDLHAFEGTHPFRKPPVVLGHEISGTVAEVGARVSRLSPGDRVTVMPYRACGRCLYCRRGRTNVCENKTVPGIKGWLGTFAERFVAPESVTYRLGGRTDLRAGCLAEPLAVGAHAARQARLDHGSHSLVLGAGTIGLLTAYAALRYGAERVAATDLYDHNLRVARSLGVAHTYNARAGDVEQAIRVDHPQGFDTVFLTGGSEQTVLQALRLVQRGGRVVVTAILPRPVTLDLIPLTMYELELIGTQIYRDADYRDALTWLDEDGHRLARLIDRVMPLDAAHEALTMMAQRHEALIKILLQP